MSRTKTAADWANTTFLSGVADIRKLKESDGGDLIVWGSGDLIQTLFEHDLVDELQLVTYPVTLGSGKKLFDRGTIPASLTVSGGAITPKGVVFARYTRAGAVETGTV